MQMNPKPTHPTLSITLLQKTTKSMIYQCKFLSSNQTTTIKLINMQHIHMIYNPKLLDQEICVKHDYQCIGFFSIEPDEGKGDSKGDMGDMGQGQGKGKGKEENSLGRFLLEVALLRMQEDVDGVMDRREVRDIRDGMRRYLYGADGVLYSNLIIYSKPFQRQLQPYLQKQKRPLTTHQKSKLRNQLHILHYQQLSYKNLSPSSIVFIPDSDGMSKRKMTEELAQYDIIFTPVLKIGSNVQPVGEGMGMGEVEEMYRRELEELEEIMGRVGGVLGQDVEENLPVPVVVPVNAQVGMEKKKSSFSISQQLQTLSSKPPQKQSISYNAFVSLQKILQIPKLYMLIQQSPTIQKFHQQVQKLRKTKLNETELQWYLVKYQQLTSLNNATSPNNSTPTTLVPGGRNNSPSNGRLDYGHSLSKSVNSTNLYNNGNSVNMMNLGAFGNNCQLQALVKEGKNLMEDRYRPVPDNEGMLGWGDLNIRYNYSISYQSYLKSLQKYQKQLSKHQTSKKCRKQYHFYTSKLLQSQSKYNQSILNLKQALKIITETLASLQSQSHSHSDLQSYNLTRNYYNCQRSVKGEYASVCHQIGRLYVEIKRYKEAMRWYDECLRVKEEVYGRCSIEMLSTLYNIIHILLNHDIETPPQPLSLSSSPCPSHPSPHLQPYLHLLSQTKQRIPNQQVLTEWTQSLTIKSQISINMITKIQQELTDLYYDPWRDELMRLFAGKVNRNRGTNGKTGLGMGMGMGSWEEVGRKGIGVEEVGSDGEVSLRNQERVLNSITASMLTLQDHQPKNTESIKTSQQKSKTLLSTINSYLNTPLQPQTFSKIFTLKQHLTLTITYLQSLSTPTTTSLIQQQQILLQCITNLKTLHNYIKQNRNSRGWSGKEFGELMQSVVEIVYELYGIVGRYLWMGGGIGGGIDWKWVLSEYYMYGSPQTPLAKTRRQQKLKNTLQYCLLIHKFYKDYSRIYNSLTPSPKSPKPPKFPVPPAGSPSHTIFHYLLTICLIHMHRYNEAIAAVNSVLVLEQGKKVEGKGQGQGEDEGLFGLYQLLPKGMVYWYQFVFLGLHCWFKVRDYRRFVQVFENENLAKMQVQSEMSQKELSGIGNIMKQQHNCIINMAISVYQHLSSTDPSQSPTTINLLQTILQTTPQKPCKQMLKILQTSPTKLLPYIKTILKHYPPHPTLSKTNTLNTTHPNTLPQNPTPQTTVLLDILEQNNKEELTDILVFYLEVLNVLVAVYRDGDRDRGDGDGDGGEFRGYVCGVLEQVLEGVFAGWDQIKEGANHLLKLEFCNKTIQIAILLNSQPNNPVLSYFPKISQTLQFYHNQAHPNPINPHSHSQSQSQFQQHSHPTHPTRNKSSHHTVSLFNHRYKMQIMLMFQVLICWFRKQGHWAGVVFCRCFLGVCGRRVGKEGSKKGRKDEEGKEGEDGLREEVEILCGMLGLGLEEKNSEQCGIVCPPIFSQFNMQVYLIPLIQTFQLLQKQCQQFQKSYHNLLPTPPFPNSTQLPPNIDPSFIIHQIQQKLLCLQSLRLNLTNFLPSEYMEKINQDVLDVMRKNLEMM